MKNKLAIGRGGRQGHKNSHVEKAKPNCISNLFPHIISGKFIIKDIAIKQDTFSHRKKNLMLSILFLD